VGMTKFVSDYVFRPGGSEIVRGTKGVKRLRLVDLGERAKGAIMDEVDEMVEAFRAERDGGHPGEPGQ